MRSMVVKAVRGTLVVSAGGSRVQNASRVCDARSRLT